MDWDFKMDFLSLLVAQNAPPPQLTAKEYNSVNLVAFRYNLLKRHKCIFINEKCESKSDIYCCFNF